MWPCSADSSRNAGPWPRSFRNADTGVSRSSMNRLTTGITFASRASSSARSRVGSRPSLCSAATAIQQLQHLRHRDVSRQQQNVEVVHEVSALLRDSLLGLRPGGLRDLACLLPPLRADLRRVIEQLDRVRAGRALVRARDEYSLQFGQRLVGGRRRLTGCGRRVDRRLRCALEVAVEARALARVTRRPGRYHQSDERVAVAVITELAHTLDVAGRLALVPHVAARAAVEMHLAGPPGALESLLVHVRDHQHLAGAPVLDHARHESALELAPGRRADVAHHLAAAPDEYPLLRFGLGPHLGVDLD